MPEIKCPKNRRAKKGLTPYQGDSRTFGYFSCEQCSNDWSSAFSWADTAQKCEICKKFVFPHNQIPLKLRLRKRNKGNSKALPHLQESCGKCIEIGGSCTKIKKCFELPPSPTASPSTQKPNAPDVPQKRRRRTRNVCKA